MGVVRRGSLFWLAVLILVASVSPAAARHLVMFDQEEYTVSPGGSFQVKLNFDWDTVADGLQPCPDGLGALGLRLTFGGSDARLVDAETDVVMPPAFTTTEGGILSGDNQPHRDCGAGWVEARGSIGFLDPGYDGTLLATLDLENLAAAGTSYDLSLGFFHTNSFANFATPTADTLDGDITFGSATVTVVPEPGTFAMAALVCCFICGWATSRKRRH